MLIEKDISKLTISHYVIKIIKQVGNFNCGWAHKK
ncbi:MAG: hypothetical protein ACI9HU_000870 [Colwellia sp.]|jgi:hypothetical protein